MVRNYIKDAYNFLISSYNKLFGYEHNKSNPEQKEIFKEASEKFKSEDIESALKNAKVILPYRNLTEPTPETNIRLFKAVESNDFEEVKNIIENSSKKNELVNAKNFIKIPLIHVAAEKSNSEIIDYLCKNGADVNATNLTYLTALAIVVQKNDIPSIESLLKHGAEVNTYIYGDLIKNKLTELNINPEDYKKTTPQEIIQISNLETPSPTHNEEVDYHNENYNEILFEHVLTDIVVSEIMKDY
ncbi:MAG: ankyrin repeat domain-containing protein [Sphingobacteriia bacterium]|nr:ankyrin repeat domain-containing protein [Sphingobacteriia bacterium]